MPTSAAVVVFAIVVAFAIFAAVLAWGDYQTRNLASKAAKGPSKETH